MSRQGEFDAGPETVEMMPLDELLATHHASDTWAPGDRPVLEDLGRGRQRVGPQPWDKVFENMDAERQGPYWDEFKAHVRAHGVQTPIVLHAGLVQSGHHRVWAAHAAGLPAVPVIRATTPERSVELSNAQGDEETAWRK